MKALVPQYQKIYNALLKKINKGEFTKETPIPSENELSVKYEVSRMTARKSVDMLVNEGYLSRQKGKGTFITGRKNIKADEISLTARLRYEDKRVYNEVLSCVLKDDINPEIKKKLKLSTSCKTWEIKRVRYISDVPAIFETIFIPVTVGESVNQENAKGSMTSFIEGYKDIEKLELSCRPGVIDGKKKASFLNMKKEEPILLVEAALISNDGEVCLYSESFQNTAVLPFISTIAKR